MNKIKMLGVGMAITTVAWAAPEFPPIPPEAWALKEADSQGTGAICLTRDLQFSKDGTFFRIRVRILNEAGRLAVADENLPVSLTGFRGRVVNRDGQERLLDKDRDMGLRDVAQPQWGKVQARRVVVSRLTDDCVVDLDWELPVNEQIKSSTYFHGRTLSFPLALAYPILEETVELADPPPVNWCLSGWKKPESETRNHIKRFILRNVPAAPPLPFAAAGHRNLPKLEFSSVPEKLQVRLNSSLDQYWEAVGDLYFKPLFEPAKADNAYRQWAPGILGNLPPTPQAAAYELALRLDADIRNIASLTYQELDAQDKGQAGRRIIATDLDATVRDRRTNPEGMLLLYLRLLHDAGIPARILLVADRNLRLFDCGNPDLHQFTDSLVAVPEPGHPLLVVDPALRFAQPGMIEGRYQGTPALSLDPETWKTGFVTVPVLPARTSVSRYLCKLGVNESEVGFRVEAAFTGLPEYEVRKRFLALEPPAQAKLLREDLEARDRSLRLASTEVSNAADPRKNVTWKAEGSWERNPGGKLVLRPFPGVPMPVQIPASWPAERKDPIVLPRLDVFAAVSTVAVPEGWKPLPVEDLVRTNGFGSVRWTQKLVEGKAGREVQVLLTVETTQLVAGPEQYADLKSFVAWVQEAFARDLVMERL